MKKHPTLHLTLKKQWWDMIASGEKLEEYREIKPYWTSRLCNLSKRFNGMVGSGQKCTDTCSFARLCLREECILTDYYYVCFHYGRTAQTMYFELSGIYIDEGKPEWGAPVGEKVFILMLGERIDK
jgi:hypothetical protein